MPAPLSRWSLVLALVAMSLLFWAAAGRMTVTIDGVRYDYLDDDEMISMRYARNLAEGHGIVWNPGERVEGYTNFGWVLAMAAVHRAGAPDPTAAWWVRVVNWLFACAVLACTWRLLVRLGVGGSIVTVATMLALALSSDLLSWAVNGFETTMLTAVFLWSLVRALEESERGAVTWTTLLLAGLLPVIRADAVDLAAGVVLVAVTVSGRRAWRRAWIALVPLVAHELFRVAYYGDWLPNTFYLKVAGRDGLWWTAAGNVKGFAATYPALVVLAAAALFAGRDRRVRVLAVLPVAGVVRVLFTGPDIFHGFRFLAPYVPVLVVVAGAMVMDLAAGSAVRIRTLAGLLFVVTVANAGVTGRTRFEELLSVNGRPEINTVTGVLIARHTRPQATLAVLAAGNIGYFSRRATFDMLGKTDRHVARLPVRSTAPTGHNRYDMEWSLARHPDLVAAFAPHVDGDMPEVRSAAYRADENYLDALATSRAFRARYYPHPVPVAYLLERNALYVRDDSPERAGLGSWRQPRVTSP